MKTSRDVCDRALRSLGVVASGNDMTAEEFRDAKAAFEGLFSELQDKEGFDLSWTIETVPEWAFLPLAQMLAVEMAGDFRKQVARRQYWEGLTRLRRHAFPDDRTPAGGGSEGPHFL